MERRRLTEKRWQDQLAHIDRLATLKGATFKGDTAARRAARIARAVLDVGFFAHTYLPHYFTSAPATFHRELFRIVAEDRFAVIEAARGHGKTVTFTFADTAWRVARAGIVQAFLAGELDNVDPHLTRALRTELAARSMAEPQRVDPFIVLSHCIEEAAEEYTYDVKIEFEENPLLIGDFGELVYDAGVNYGDFEANGVRVVAVGLGRSRRGIRNRQHRPTLWKVDDPDDDRTLSSEAVRDRHFRRLTAFVLPALDPVLGRCLVIGNEVHPDGVVGRIWHDQERPVHEQRFPAWAKYQFNARDEQGRPLWPERFPGDVLAAMERMDPAVFEVEFMNAPRSGEGRPFKSLHHFDREAYAGKVLPTVMVADPALGRTRSSDLQALVVVKFDASVGAFLVWRAHLTRLPPLAWRRLFLDVYEQEEPDLAGIEDVGFQELLIVLVELLGDAEAVFPAVVRIPQHQAKELRILSLAPLNDRMRLLFPSDGSCSELEKQFLRHPDGKVDGPDCTEMGVRLLKQHVRGVSGKDVRHGARRGGQRHARCGRAAWGAAS